MKLCHLGPHQEPHGGRLLGNRDIRRRAVPARLHGLVEQLLRELSHLGSRRRGLVPVALPLRPIPLLIPGWPPDVVDSALPLVLVRALFCPLQPPVRREPSAEVVGVNVYQLADDGPAQLLGRQHRLEVGLDEPVELLHHGCRLLVVLCLLLLELGQLFLGELV